MQTKSEKEDYLLMIKSGHLDIIVGTHALLGNRVAYNNLGLLVVDEEQVKFLFLYFNIFVLMWSLKIEIICLTFAMEHRLMAKEIWVAGLEWPSFFRSSNTTLTLYLCPETTIFVLILTQVFYLSNVQYDMLM